MQMLPIIADTNFVKRGIIDDYVSFIWTARYYKAGDFELCVDVDAKNLDLIHINYYVLRDDDKHVGIIESIRIERNEDGHEMMIASGRFLASIVGRRIIAAQTQVSGLVASCVEKLLNENAIFAVPMYRRIPKLSFLSLLTSDVRMQQQFTGTNLLDAISSICQAYGYGFRVVLTETNGFRFELFAGVDRSRNQSVNPWVVFSDEYDNLLSSEYEENHKNIVTDVLVAGEGEGLDRKTVWESLSTNIGLNRYEKYKDARNASTNNGEISDEDYYLQLQGIGKDEITTITQAFSGQVYFGSVEYKKDVNIGDICIIENERWGIAINSRLIEVIESTSETGEYTITPTFGI